MSLLNDEVSACLSDRQILRLFVSNLMQWGCCIRCILRLLGIKNADVYRTYDLAALLTWAEEICSDSEKSKTGVDIPVDECDIQDIDVNMKDNSSKKTPCVCCFGILQEIYCQPEFIQEIAKAVLKQNYEFKTFLCSVSTPVCLVPREHAVWMALDELLPDECIGADRSFMASVKDVWKWINGPLLASCLGVPFDQKSPFEVLLTFIYRDNDEECSFLYRLFPGVFQRRKKNKHGWEVFNRANVARAIEDTKADVFRRYFSCPPTCPPTFATYSPILCQQSALYIAGRYNKYSRHLSQTPWVVDGKRKSELSVEELICDPLNKTVLASEWKFSSSGREDVDVRMLGTGRPFVVEFINPRRIYLAVEELSALQAAINAGTKDVAVRDLQIVAKDDTNVLKECEEDKMKSYVALCWSRDPVPDDLLSSLSSMVNVTLQQQTPIRVLHRRTLATRERTVYNMSAEKVGAENGAQTNYFALALSTQAGTYVKEFVHGDLGRTAPSLGTLLNNECDILALDVVGVELDWPKSLGV